MVRSLSLLAVSVGLAIGVVGVVGVDEVLAVGPSDAGTSSVSTSSDETSTSPELPATKRIGAAIASTVPAYIVRTNDRESLERVVRRLEYLGIEPLEQWKSMFAVLVNLDAGSLDVVRADPAVLSVEADQPIHATATETSPPWGLDRIDQRLPSLDGTYTSDQSGSGVTAYVIDSGLWFSHDEFVGRVPRSAFLNFGDGTGASDCNGHGTHVSGTLGGTTFGVAKGVSIVPVKVLNCAGSGSNSGVIAGINWVIGDHAAGVPAVANLSLGGAASSSVDAAVQALIADGVTVVVAAGNDNVDACSFSPARVGAAITVAASESPASNFGIDRRAPYSNWGTCNDLFAPGTAILSAFPGVSNHENAVLSGTSMASPHVAGAAALLLQAHPTATPAQIWTMIDTSSTVRAMGFRVNGDPDKLLYIGHDYQLFVDEVGAGTVSASPVGGMNCGPGPSGCWGSYPPSTTVSLAASPSSGYQFSGWSGAGCAGASACSVTMDAAKTVTATFTLIPPAFQAVVPARLLDSRVGGSTVDGLFEGVGLRGGGSVTELTVAGRGGVPVDAAAVVLNVTVSEAQGSGFVTVFPCGSPQPNASSVNFVAGQTVPNAVIAKVGGAGAVCLFTSAPVHLIVDVNGYFP